MYYQFYEWNHAILSPARAVNDAIRLYYKNPLNPLSHTEFGRQIAAAGDLFERMTRHYGKPDFDIDETVVDGVVVPVEEKVVWARPFCRLLKFERALPPGAPQQPNVVLVAPMSGHYATLLRGTVEALLPFNNVYITDWADARKVPLAAGHFNLDDFIDYVIDIIEHFDGNVHLVAVCQPAVPVFAAAALLEARTAAVLPKSLTLMGGPIDTRRNPTEVNAYAEKHTLDWFRRNVIMPVPFPHPGVMRKVYPGFLQLSGFMTMNLDRHLSAHYEYFDHLVKGDGDSADKHREFYDEYLSVMDLTAEFYLQTVDTVFLRQALPKGEMMHRGTLVDPSKITRTPIFTVEGEKDDISGLGQTQAAHTLTPNLPAEKHQHYMQPEVGHYGVFNGSRFRKEIVPRICAFVEKWESPEPLPAVTAPAAAVAPPEPAAEEPAAPEATSLDSNAPAVETMEAVPAPAANPAPMRKRSSRARATTTTDPSDAAPPAEIEPAATAEAAPQAEIETRSPEPETAVEAQQVAPAPVSSEEPSPESEAASQTIEETVASDEPAASEVVPPAEEAPSAEASIEPEAAASTQKAPPAAKASAIKPAVSRPVKRVAAATPKRGSTTKTAKMSEAPAKQDARPSAEPPAKKASRSSGKAAPATPRPIAKATESRTTRRRTPRTDDRKS